MVNLGGIDLNGATAGTPTQKTSTSRSGSVEVADEAAPGSVSITSTATLLAHVEQSLGAQPAVDPERVATISRAIAAGTYLVRPESVAAGLIQSERSLASLPMREI